VVRSVTTGDLPSQNGGDQEKEEEEEGSPGGSEDGEPVNHTVYRLHK